MSLMFILEPRRVVQLLKDGVRREGKKNARRRGALRQNQARMRWRRSLINSVVSSSEWLQGDDDMVNSSESSEDDSWWHSHKVSTEDITERIPSEGSGYSESVERHVEVLVVADRSMLEFHHEHGGTDVETYLLTVMNMVSSWNCC